MRAHLFTLRAVHVSVMVLLLLPQRIQADDFNDLLDMATAHWPMQDAETNTTVKDTAGSNDATLQGGQETIEITTTGPNGWYPKAFDLDGSPDYISFSSITTSANADGTWVIWYNPENLTSTNVIAGNSGNADERMYVTSGSGLARYVTASSETLTWNSDSVTEGVWSCLIVTRDDNNDTWRWYTNGVENSSAITGKNVALTLDQFGRRSTGTSWCDDIIAGAAYFPISFTEAQAGEWTDGPEPVNIDSPVASSDGTPEVGETVSVSNGVWDLPPPFDGLWNGSVSYAYQWQRDTGTGFNDISGETSSTYTLAAADGGNDVRCEVTASNAGGTGDTAASNSLTVSTVVSFGSATTLTISSGSVTATTASHRLAAESGTSDSLDTLNGGFEGRTIVLTADTGDLITVEDEASGGNINIKGDAVLDDDDTLVLIYTSSEWIEITRSID